MPQGRAAIDPRNVALFGLVAVGAYVVSMVYVLNKTTYDQWGALVIGPLLVLISLPILHRQAVREGDPRTFPLLSLALIVKLLGALPRYYVAFITYGGVADASGYHGAGIRWAEQLSHGDFTGITRVRGTEFLQLVTGLIYTVTRPNLLGGFLVFSWLGFWGLFFFYRAFVLAVPNGSKRSYAHLLFFLPSLVFWPSSIGKEAIMVLALGAASYGISRVLTHDVWGGLAFAVPGLWLGAMVRPHMAGVAALSGVTAMLLRPIRASLGTLRPVLRVAGLAVALALMALLIVQTNRLTQELFMDVQSGVGAAFSEVTERTSQGGSEFTAPSVPASPIHFPAAAITVLYRPFLFEGGGGEGLLAALEGTFLMILTLSRLRWAAEAIRRARRESYIAFAIVYTTVVIVLFSTVGNFGILTRQRVQLLPLFLVLLAVPPKARMADAEEARDAQLVSTSWQADRHPASARRFDDGLLRSSATAFV